MLGSLLTSSDTLIAGQRYTFTFHSGEWFFLYSTDTIKSELAPFMTDLGEVLSVNRSLFSDHYVVTVVPYINEILESWIALFDYAWHQIGYDTVEYLSAEGGTTSTQPGGIVEIIPQIGEIGVETIKPIIPYALGFLAIYLVITFTPVLSKKRRGA